MVLKPAPLRGLGALAVPEQAAGVTGLTLAALHSPPPPHSDGDGLPPGELVRWHRGASPGRMMAPSHRCQGVKCPRTGAGARVRGALERGGPRSRVGRTLERGGACSRGNGPSSEVEPVRGKRTPSNGTEPARGRRASLSEAKPARGDLQEGRLGGPLRSPRHGPCPAWLGKVCSALLRVLSGDFPVVKGDP
jgi:hypothetical protein